MGWIRCVHCEKLQRDFMAQTSVWMEPVEYVLQQVSCSYETIWNAPKYYAMHQNMSLRSNVADWVRSLRKIPAWLCGTYFCINCTSSHYFAPSFWWGHPSQRYTHAYYAAHQNMSLRSNVEDWVRSLRKIRAWLCGTYFCINCTSPHYFTPSFMQLRNNPKCT